jgi:hypothetical protein
MCQVVAETVSTGETIDMTCHGGLRPAGGHDGTDIVNKVYSALPDGAVVYIAQAFGWDSAEAPTTVQGRRPVQGDRADPHEERSRRRSTRT